VDSNNINAEDHGQGGSSVPDRPRGSENPDGRRPRAVVVTPTYDEKESIADLIAAVLAEQKNVPDFD
jgi:hypothetical protein